MLSGYSQTDIPYPLNSVVFQLNGDTHLSKPYCYQTGTSLNYSIKRQVPFDLENPHYDPEDPYSYNYFKSSILVSVVSHLSDFTLGEIEFPDNLFDPEPEYTLTYEYLGYIEDYMGDSPKHFFEITINYIEYNYYSYIAPPEFNFNLLFSLESLSTLIESPISTLFTVNFGSMEGFDKDELEYEYPFDYILDHQVGNWFSSNPHVLIDGQLTPQNLSNYVDENNPSEFNLLTSPDYACQPSEVDFPESRVSNLMLLGDLVLLFVVFDSQTNFHCNQ